MLMLNLVSMHNFVELVYGNSDFESSVHLRLECENSVKKSSDNCFSSYSRFYTECNSGALTIVVVHQDSITESKTLDPHFQYH